MCKKFFPYLIVFILIVKHPALGSSMGTTNDFEEEAFDFANGTAIVQKRHLSL
jgi:hypothetical protein